MSTALTTTPTVLSSAAGTATWRRRRQDVCRPPSYRINARPTIPTWRASSALSNSIPPSPSEPSTIPSARNATRTGSPVRAAPSANTTLKARTAPTARSISPSSTALSSPVRPPRVRLLGQSLQDSQGRHVDSCREGLPDDRGAGGRDLGAVARARRGDRGARASMASFAPTTTARSSAVSRRARSTPGRRSRRSRREPSGSGSGRWSRRSLSALRRCSRRTSSRSTTSPAAGSSSASAPAGTKPSTRPTASRSAPREPGSTSSTGSSPRSRASGRDADDVCPRPLQQPRPPIIVGGRAKPRTVAAAVRFADEYNTVFPSVEEARERAGVVADAARQRAASRFASR